MFFFQRIYEKYPSFFIHLILMEKLIDRNDYSPLIRLNACMLFRTKDLQRRDFVLFICLTSFIYSSKEDRK